MSDKTYSMKQAIAVLATIMSASGRIIPGVPSKNGTPATPPHGELTLETEGGPIVMTCDDFDNIYRGFVSCWPTVKPLKNQLVLEGRQAIIADREAKKANENAAKEKAKADKIAEKAKLELDKVKAKEAKAKEKADADAAKIKAKVEADKAKAKALADKAKELEKAAKAKVAATKAK